MNNGYETSCQNNNDIKQDWKLVQMNITFI